MIRPSFGPFLELVGQFSFYLNDQSLYFTNKTDYKKNDYRNVIGAIPVKKMIAMPNKDEDDSELIGEERAIRKG